MQWTSEVLKGFEIFHEIFHLCFLEIFNFLGILDLLKIPDVGMYLEILSFFCFPKLPLEF